MQELEDQIIGILRELTALCKDESAADPNTPRSGNKPTSTAPNPSTSSGATPQHIYTTGNFSSSFYWNTENLSVLNTPYVTNQEHQRILHNQGLIVKLALNLISSRGTLCGNRLAQNVGGIA